MTNAKILLIASAGLLLSSSFQAEAAVRSIIDVGKSEFGLNFSNVDTGLKTDTLCTDTGYTLTSCESSHTPDETSRCPSNPKYFKYCLCDTSYYDITLKENETIENICGKSATIQGCIDKKGSHYTCSCANDSLTLCNAENEYPLAIKATYVCRSGRNENLYWIQKNSCKSCEAPLVVNASKSGCSCPTEYKECNLGPEVGANSCTENGVTKYDNCKSCAYRGTNTTCPAGYVPRKTSPWAEKLLCTGSRGTSCITCGEDLGGGLRQLIDGCGKRDNGFGMQDIFSYAAREQGLLGSGTWDTNKGKMIVILAGDYQSLNTSFKDDATNNGYAVVDTGAYATICNSSNSAMKDTAYGIKLRQDLNSGDYIIIRYNQGQVKSVVKGNGTLPTGSGSQPVYQDGYFM